MPAEIRRASSGQGSQFGAQVFVFGIVKIAPAQPARRLVERGLPAGERRLEIEGRRLRQNGRRQAGQKEYEYYRL